MIKDLDSKLKFAKNSSELIEKDKMDLTERLRQVEEEYSAIKKVIQFYRLQFYDSI